MPRGPRIDRIGLHWVFLLSVVAGTALLAGEPARAPVLDAAPGRIEKHRTGPIVVRVVDAKGNPAAGARVTVKQRHHEFLFGCNLFLFGRVGKPDDEEAYRSRFAAIFNYATLPFYWGGYEPERGKPGHEYREEAARWCQEHGIAAKGHPLVWNHPASVPAWLPAEPAEVRALSNARVADCVTRFRGLIDIWDVVNESTDPMRFRRDNKMTAAYEKFGVLESTLEPFLVARRASPDAKLIINDYRTDEAFAKLISALVHDGKPVYSAIGIQSHMHDGVWPPERVWEVCESFARFGVPLHFTETTIVSGPRKGPGENWGPTEKELEEVQAQRAVEFYTVLFSHPAVEAITWWDFADRRAWQGAAAGFLRKDLSAKPIYERLLELIRGRWWTEASATADAKGEATVAAFFGVHEITAERSGVVATARLAHTRRAGASRVELKLGG